MLTTQWPTNFKVYKGVSLTLHIKAYTDINFTIEFLNINIYLHQCNNMRGIL